METPGHRLLIHGRLKGGLKHALICIAVKGTQCGTQLVISEVKAIHNGDRIGTEPGQGTLQTNLEFAHIRVRQVDKLLKWKFNEVYKTIILYSLLIELTRRMSPKFFRVTLTR